MHCQKRGASGRLQTGCQKQLSKIPPSHEQSMIQNGMYLINTTFKLMSSDRNNVLSTLNYLEGQIITSRKCIKPIISYVIFLVHTNRKKMDEKVLQSVLLGNIWIIFDFFP